MLAELRCARHTPTAQWIGHPQRFRNFDGWSACWRRQGVREAWNRGRNLLKRGQSTHTQIACQIHCMVQAEPWAWRRGDSGGCRQRPRGAADCSHIERAPCELEPRGRGWRRSRRRPRPEESWDTGRRIVMEHGASSAGTG